MNTPEPQKVSPPDSSEIKKVAGKSFVKRNAWLIVIVAVFAIVGICGWLAYIRVKRVLKKYESVVDADTVKYRSLKASNSVFVVPYSNTIKSSTLNIEGSSAVFKLRDETSSLFSADTKTKNNKYHFEGKKEGAAYVMNLSSQNDGKKSNFAQGDDSVRIRLNINPEWGINIKAGAAEFDFDLSKYKVKSIKLDGGAGSFIIKLGQPLATTDINISTGAAEVKFTIPQNAACHITKSSAFSSNDFEGFIKKGDSDYETPGFDAAKNKFYIHFSGAMSSFEVKRY
ncbi:MAG TPA: hypothetical protein VK671_08820 [Mucilaginibacter sp.]|jgi:hypothetical protein|nr:hypothetical protein [Mucilaginibacter sp.]